MVVVLRDVSRGRVAAIMVSMSDALPCHHVPNCTACAHIGISYQTQLDRKLAQCRTLFGSAGLPAFDPDTITEITPSPRIAAYRNRVRLVVRSGGSSAVAGQSGIALGLYRAGTHDVVDIPNCPVQVEPINATVEVLRELIATSRMSLYDELTGAGDLRYVSVRAGINTGEILVGLVGTRSQFPGSEPLAQELMRRCSQVVGVVLNINTTRGNAIFGHECECLAGRDHLFESVCSIRVPLGLQSFFQINTGIAELAYTRIVEHLTDGLPDPKSRLNVLDLYCGVGTIGLLSARQVGRVTGIERDPGSIDHARCGARLNNLDNVSFVSGDVGQVMSTTMVDHGIASKRDQLAVVVNPPRKGLSPETIQQLLALAPDRVVYLSCAPVTLLRDLTEFTKASYALRCVELFDMFPQTDQVETLAVLHRR